MDKLKAYLNALPPAEQADFAIRCHTTIGYLRKAISKRQKIGESICIAIERESGRSVVCEDLRDDVDWAYLRNTPQLVRPVDPAAVRPAPRQLVLPELRRRPAVATATLSLVDRRERDVPVESDRRRPADEPEHPKG